MSRKYKHTDSFYIYKISASHQLVSDFSCSLTETGSSMINNDQVTAKIRETLDFTYNCTQNQPQEFTNMSNITNNWELKSTNENNAETSFGLEFSNSYTGENQNWSFLSSNGDIYNHLPTQHQQQQENSSSSKELLKSIDALLIVRTWTMCVRKSE
jgi:hypothetical protein